MSEQPKLSNAEFVKKGRELLEYIYPDELEKLEKLFLAALDRLEAAEARVKELRQEAQHKEACCRDLSRRNEELKAELAIVTAQRDAREEELVTRMVEETEEPHE